MRLLKLLQLVLLTGLQLATRRDHGPVQAKHWVFYWPWLKSLMIQAIKRSHSLMQHQPLLLTQLDCTTNQSESQEFEW